jgi:hypothetical protein
VNKLRVTVVKAQEGLGTQRKWNVRCWKQLPKDWLRHSKYVCVCMCEGDR